MRTQKQVVLFLFTLALSCIFLSYYFSVPTVLEIGLPSEAQSFGRNTTDFGRLLRNAVKNKVSNETQREVSNFLIKFTVPQEVTSGTVSRGEPLETVPNRKGNKKESVLPNDANSIDINHTSKSASPLVQKEEKSKILLPSQGDAEHNKTRPIDFVELSSASELQAGQIVSSNNTKHESAAEMPLDKIGDGKKLSASESTSVSTLHGYRPKTKFFLTLCSMIKNDVPYIVEWIEFLRFQGVDRFFLYDDRSADNLTLLNQFYRERDPDAHVYVVEAPSVSKFERLNHVVADCFRRYANDTEWMMIADTDEFLYSPVYGTITNLTKMASKIEGIRGHPIDQLTAECSIFGTSGRINRFQYRLVLDEKGKVQYVNDCGLQLMIDKVLRGPDERRNSSDKPLQDKLMSTIEVCKRGGDSKGCDHTPGKSIFKPTAVEVPDVHAPRSMKPGHYFPQHNRANLFEGRGDLPPTQVFACNHFYKRSYQDAYLKAFQWGMWQHLENFNHTNTAVFGTVKDDYVRRTWYKKMEKRMRELSVLGSDSGNDPVCQ